MCLPPGLVVMMNEIMHVKLLAGVWCIVNALLEEPGLPVVGVPGVLYRPHYLFPLFPGLISG